VGFRVRQGAAHILISHTHWDHIQGLPFFALSTAPATSSSCMPASATIRICAACFLAGRFPILPGAFHQARADVSFRELHDGPTSKSTMWWFPALASTIPTSPRPTPCPRRSQSGVYRGHGALLGHSVWSRVHRRTALAALRAEQDRPQDASDHAQPGGSAVEGADLVIYDTMFTPRSTARHPTLALASLGCRRNLSRRGRPDAGAVPSRTGSFGHRSGCGAASTRKAAKVTRPSWKSWLASRPDVAWEGMMDVTFWACAVPFLRRARYRALRRQHRLRVGSACPTANSSSSTAERAR